MVSPYIQRMSESTRTEAEAVAERGIRCAECGRFISHADMQSGAARFDFTPDSHFGPEINEWTCPTCLGTGKAREKAE